VNVLALSSSSIFLEDGLDTNVDSFAIVVMVFSPEEKYEKYNLGHILRELIYLALTFHDHRRIFCPK